MDASHLAEIRDLLVSTGWVDRTRTFARALTRSTTERGGLLVVGTPEEEPWHLTAHLDDEARISGIAELTPTLVRWKVPDGAPPHLAVTMARLEAARRGETVFVVAEDVAPDPLLERVWDARKLGATILSLDGGDTELEGMAHESLVVSRSDLVVPGLSFDSVQHLVSMAVGDESRGSSGAPVGGSRGGPTGGSGGKGRLRERLAKALDTLSGPA